MSETTDRELCDDHAQVCPCTECAKIDAHFDSMMTTDRAPQGATEQEVESRGKPIMAMKLSERLDRIADIIEAVDNRCMAADGPVTPTLQEMTQAEISEIYALAACPPLVVNEEGCQRIAAELR